MLGAVFKRMVSRRDGWYYNGSTVRPTAKGMYQRRRPDTQPPDWDHALCDKPVASPGGCQNKAKRGATHARIKTIRRGGNRLYSSRT